jgi:hypothetical protein
MIILVSILSFIICILAIGLFFFARRALQLKETLDNLGHDIEQALDIIDVSYSKIHKVSRMSLAMDDPVIRQLVIDIKQVQNAVLIVANKLVAFEKDTIQEVDEEEEA